MNIKSFHISVQGASHIKNNKECQDASVSYSDETCSIIIVCDGHGGDDYVRSAVGSSLATKVTEKNVKNFIKTISAEDMRKDHKKLLKNLEASIINDWNEAVYAYNGQNPFTEEELSIVSEKAKKKYIIDGDIESAYGTTVIAVAVTNEYWFGIHIGDGKCVAINPEGKFSQPIPWDEKCFMNVTTSICDSTALDNFRDFYSEKLPIAVFIGSDGIDDSFTNNEQLNHLYKTVLYSFASNSFENAYEDFKDYLPRLSLKGSGDDMSVAAILNLDMIGELEVVKSFDAEKEKKRLKEKAQVEAEKQNTANIEVKNNHNSREESKHTMETELKFCEKCGTRLLKEMKFCSECGNRIQSIETSSSTDQVIQTIDIPKFNNTAENVLYKEDNIEIVVRDAREEMTQENAVAVEQNTQVDEIQADVIEESNEDNLKDIMSEISSAEVVEAAEIIPEEQKVSMIDNEVDTSKDTDKDMVNA